MNWQSAKKEGLPKLKGSTTTEKGTIVDLKLNEGTADEHLPIHLAHIHNGLNANECALYLLKDIQPGAGVVVLMRGRCRYKSHPSH